jgi:hypothetical protein
MLENNYEIPGLRCRIPISTARDHRSNSQWRDLPNRQVPSIATASFLGGHWGLCAGTLYRFCRVSRIALSVSGARRNRNIEISRPRLGTIIVDVQIQLKPA